MFRVYQDGKRCSEYNIWDKDTFKTKREAEVFAFYWAFPVGFVVAQREAPELDIGIEYDFLLVNTLL